MTSLASWRLEPIGRSHDRESFDCGEQALNEFLRLHARRNHDVGVSKTFAAVSDADNRTVLGYYTLSPASVAYARTPEFIRRKLPRYDVPGFRLARLAVDRQFQGQGLGAKLLASAARRCLRAAIEVGGVVLLIDAKDEKAAKWYRRFGAVSLDGSPLTLMLPLKTVEMTGED
jgi:GNAT superfamily N-acetyltransferase